MSPDARARMSAGGMKSRRPPFAPTPEQESILARLARAEPGEATRRVARQARDAGIPLRVIAARAGVTAQSVLRWTR